MAAYHVLASTLQVVTLARAPADCPACVCEVDTCGAGPAPLEGALPALTRSLDVIQDAYRECSTVRAQLRATCEPPRDDGFSRVSLTLLFFLGCPVGTLVTLLVSCCLSLTRRAAAVRPRDVGQPAIEDSVVVDVTPPSATSRTAATPSSLRAIV